MTKKQLTQAQYFLNCYESSSRAGKDELAVTKMPTQVEEDIAQAFVRIRAASRSAFFDLTGKWLGREDICATDLNTETPAEWTKHVEG